MQNTGIFTTLLCSSILFSSLLSFNSSSTPHFALTFLPPTPSFIMRFAISAALVQTAALFAVLASPSLGAALPRSECAKGHISLVANDVTSYITLLNFHGNEVFLPGSNITEAASFCHPSANEGGFEIALAVSTSCFPQLQRTTVLIKSIFSICSCVPGHA